MRSERRQARWAHRHEHRRQGEQARHRARLPPAAPSLQQCRVLPPHCAAGVHRAPTMTLAVLCAMGWDMDEAMAKIERLRPEAEFVDVYVESVRGFLSEYAVGE